MKRIVYPLFFLIFAFPAALSAQFLTSVGPDSAFQGQSLAVTISGSGTHFSQGSGALNVWLNQGSNTIYPQFNIVQSSEVLQAHFDIPQTAPLGLWDVNVYTLIDGVMTRQNDFTIYALTSSVSPAIQSALNSFRIYPNPLRSDSKVSFRLKSTERVVIEVFDLQGRSVSVLLQDDLFPGKHEIDLGSKFAGKSSGQYLVRFSVGHEVMVQRVMVQ